MRFLLPALTLIAGFVIGWLVAPSGDAPVEVEKPLATGSADKKEPATRTTTKPATSGNRQTPIQQLLEEAFASGLVNYAAIKPFAEALDDLSPGTLPEFTNFFRAQPLAKSQVFLWSLFFSAWGEFDPSGATAFIEELFDEPAPRKFFYASVLETWKAESAGEAFEFAIEKFAPAPGEIDSHLAIDFLRHLAKEDPDQAVDLAKQLGDGEVVLDLTARQVSAIAAKDRQAALDAVETLKGDAFQHAATEFVIEWSKEEPAAAAGWIAGQSDRYWGPRAYVEVSKEYFQSNPDAALDWIEGVSANQSGEQLVSRSIEAWARTNPDSASSWLIRAPSRPEHDSAIVAIGNHRANKDPVGVIEELVPRITDAAKSNELLQEVAREWQRESPAAFSNWLKDTESIEPETKIRLASREAVSDNDGSEDPPPAAPPPVDQGRFEDTDQF